ncbi:hypothetical protein MASR1M46_16120 [Bacteroidales bacterium]
MGYCIDENMNVELVIKALAMAFNNRQYRDQTHPSYRPWVSILQQNIPGKITKDSVITSMTEKSDPCIPMQSQRVNGTIKHEFLIDGRHHSLLELKPAQTVLL